MRFVLSHSHDPSECGVAYAAWRGFESPLRHEHTLATCAAPKPDGSPGSDHLLIWAVEAASEEDALAQLPRWVADRTKSRRVTEVRIP